ncbi:MAG: DUF4260 domain-containing protein [Anaerolineales bacterium]
MKNLIKLEELALFLLAVYLFAQLEYAWWLLLILFLAPDLGALGYFGGPRIGATTYDLTHHKGIAVAFYLLGALGGIQILQLVGVIMLAHSSLDRVFGYGLKYSDSFDHTHLGYIGKTAREMAAKGAEHTASSAS